MLKWLDFHKEEKRKSFLKLNNEPISDSDIYLSRIPAEEDSEDSFKHSLTSLLKSLSYALIEQRHYSQAIHCLNECLDLEDNDPEVFFRRSQARLYNKFSKHKDLELALSDIEFSISINNQKQIYLSTRDLILMRMEDLKQSDVRKIRSKDYNKGLISSMSNGYEIVCTNTSTPKVEYMNNSQKQFQVLKE